MSIDMVVSEIKATATGDIYTLKPLIRPEDIDPNTWIEQLRHDLVRRIYTGERFLKIDDLNADICDNNLYAVTAKLHTSDSDQRIGDNLKSSFANDDDQLVVLFNDKIHHFFLSGFSPLSGLNYQELDANDFSFNTQSGMCQDCQGIGTSYTWNLETLIDSNKSIRDDCVFGIPSYDTIRQKNICDYFHEEYDLDITIPWKDLPKDKQDIYLYGTTKKWHTIRFKHPRRRRSWTDRVLWKGVLNDLWDKYQTYKSQKAKASLAQHLTKQRCRSCDGSRLKPIAQNTLINGYSIADFCNKSITECISLIDQWEFDDPTKSIVKPILTDVRRKCAFLDDVGLGYLSLNRSSMTLSGGESQRVRLAGLISSGFSGLTYILDEPSIGLHPRDSMRLVDTLKALRDIGNTVIVVEHDEDIIRQADHVIDFGPGAGVNGGQIVFQGSLRALESCNESLTSEFIFRPPHKKNETKKATDFMTIHDVTIHNLKSVKTRFAKGCVNVVCGVSGSGKTSLVIHSLYQQLHAILKNSDEKTTIGNIDDVKHVIHVDQSPIGRQKRSTVSTYTGTFNHIRDFFAQLPEAKMKGLTASDFSFNRSSGTCEECKGLGYIQVEMDFLGDDNVICPACKGKRYNNIILSVTYKGHTINDVLNMTVEEAAVLFKPFRKISTALTSLQEMGLGYLSLGQVTTTLSGGEAQRIKLVNELKTPQSQHTVYILDEPTTGLHLCDVSKLLAVIRRIRDKGHTIIVIEHHTDIIKQADWVVEIGPEGGQKGGNVIFEGTINNLKKTNTPTQNALLLLMTTM